MGGGGWFGLEKKKWDEREKTTGEWCCLGFAVEGRWDRFRSRVLWVRVEERVWFLSEGTRSVTCNVWFDLGWRREKREGRSTRGGRWAWAWSAMDTGLTLGSSLLSSFGLVWVCEERDGSMEWLACTTARPCVKEWLWAPPTVPSPCSAWDWREWWEVFFELSLSLQIFNP